MAEEAWGLPIRDPDLHNLSDAQFLVRVLGPKHMGYQVVVPMTLLYVILFLTGVLGNSAVCLVIVRNRSMHTATNYYLFSLAVADLVILILGLPNELAIYWQQYPWVLGEIACKARSLISEMTSYASVLTILAFSMERYIAICHPLYQYAMAGFSRAVKIIALVWVISFLSALPYAFFTKLNYIHRPLNSSLPEDVLQDSAFCALLDENIYPQDYPLHQLSSFLFFLLPLGLLVFLYARMGLTVHGPSRSGRLQASVHGRDTVRTSRGRLLRLIGRAPSPDRRGSGGSGRSSSGSADSFQGPRQQSNKRGVLLLLVAVVVAFFICWAPFHTQRLIYVYFKHTQFFRTVNEYLFHVSGFFYYFSATINPILYNVMSLKYRHAFKATLCRKGSGGEGGGLVRTYTWRSSLCTSRCTVASGPLGQGAGPHRAHPPTGIRMAVVAGGQEDCCREAAVQAGHRPNTVCFVIQEEKESSESGRQEAAASSSFIQTIQCDLTVRVSETVVEVLGGRWMIHQECTVL